MWHSVLWLSLVLGDLKGLFHPGSFCDLGLRELPAPREDKDQGQGSGTSKSSTGKSPAGVRGAGLDPAVPRASSPGLLRMWGDDLSSLTNSSALPSKGAKANKDAKPLLSIPSDSSEQTLSRGFASCACRALLPQGFPHLNCPCSHPHWTGVPIPPWVLHPKTSGLDAFPSPLPFLVPSAVQSALL